MRGKVYQQYDTMLEGLPRSPVTVAKCAVLSEAIFAVEDDFESRRPHHPQVRALREARLRCYRSLGIEGDENP